MSTLDTQPAKVDARPRISTILWGINVILVGGIALAIIADASIDASWALIAIVGLAGVGFLALAASGMRGSSSAKPSSSDSMATPAVEPRDTASFSGAEDASPREESTPESADSSAQDSPGDDWAHRQA